MDNFAKCEDANLYRKIVGGGAGLQQRDPDEFNTNPELVEQMLNLLET